MHRLLGGAALLLLVGGGCALVGWRVHVVDGQLRADLLLQARLTAGAVDPRTVADLAGTGADLASPGYQRLKQQFQDARRLTPQGRFLYLMGRRDDGTLFFLVDSEPATSDDYSPPGQPYEEATPALRAVFDGGPSGTEGPVRDRWGTWITAYVPIQDYRSGQVLALLGMDVDAGDWRMQVYRRVLPVGLAVLLVFLIAALGIALAARRNLRPPARRTPLQQQLELLVTLAFGLVGTVGLGLLAHEAEQRSHRDTFTRLAAAEIDTVTRSLAEIRNSELEGLARFFESSERVSDQEFQRYAAYLARNPLALAWQWTPAVPTAEAEAFEAEVRARDGSDFQLWSGDGQPRPLSFPVLYQVPAGATGRLGFDLLSESVRRAAAESALATGLMTATDLLTSRAGSIRREIMVLRPVRRTGPGGPVDGFAVAVLDTEAFLRRALGALIPETPVHVQWRQLQPDGRLTTLADTGRPGEPARPRLLQVPMFAFGKTYALACRPSALFGQLYPMRAAWRAGFAGVALTALVGVLVAFQRNRQLVLERLVRERTDALVHSEAGYHRLFNAIQQAIYILDDANRFVDVNEGALAMYGMTREELIGCTPIEVSAEGRNDLEAAGQAIARARAGQPQYIQFWGRRKDGTPFPKDIWLCPGTYRGRPVVIAVANDISDRLQAESEKARLQAQQLQAQKMESIGRLAGGVAHDFNNMLQAVIGNAGLALADAPAGSPLQDYLLEIKRSAEHSADLARQLLAFASRQTVTPRILDLNDTVSGMLKMLRRLIGEDIRLNWTPGLDLWSVKLDPSQVDQVLANLCVNARDAIGGVGQVTIGTANVICDQACGERYPGCPGGEYVELTVLDTGRGMDPATVEHIFEPFFTTKPAGKGTGLGLSIVFGIVKQNNGFIAVETAPGQGTTFHILLPRAALAVPPAEPTPPAPAPRRGGECVLIVEDEKSILKLGQLSLQRLGYQVLAANSPAEAILLATQHDGEIHLLVSDVVLPDMNGWDLMKRLTALKPAMKCLFMSGYTADVIAHRGVLDESVHFLQKPFSIEALAAKVREVLDSPA